MTRLPPFLVVLSAVLVAAVAQFLPLAHALPGEGLGALAEGALAAVPGATCGAAELKNMYCRVLQDPDAGLSGGLSGCCGPSTQIIVTPGVKDSRNSTVSYTPKNTEDCRLRCAADSSCLTASAFSNNGNLFCNLFGASHCKYTRLVCSPTDSIAPSFVIHGSWIFPCRSIPIAADNSNIERCTTTHAHGVDGWHSGHGVFTSGGGGGSHH